MGGDPTHLIVDVLMQIRQADLRIVDEKKRHSRNRWTAHNIFADWGRPVSLASCLYKYRLRGAVILPSRARQWRPTWLERELRRVPFIENYSQLKCLLLRIVSCDPLSLFRFGRRALRPG